ncbi:MAG: hypothetical protein AVDCRST_MAG56-4696 [uncultured Cytophagales bacterium]|uniref:Uncharacterized protein n=1 Tax=uncultured Cytophagales bacterium TaxID=158755 RepID=A0A6J4JZ60_9SPHI|nr:MAG: hypothetical protein AVDCRST_MAG56-4696 [uncultured Cytophagales bacterium]
MEPSAGRDQMQPIVLTRSAPFLPACPPVARKTIFCNCDA